LPFAMVAELRTSSGKVKAEFRPEYDQKHKNFVATGI